MITKSITKNPTVYFSYNQLMVKKKERKNKREKGIIRSERSGGHSRRMSSQSCDVIKTRIEGREKKEKKRTPRLQRI
jgi:hypothetical protein